MPSSLSPTVMLSLKSAGPPDCSLQKVNGVRGVRKKGNCKEKVLRATAGAPSDVKGRSVGLFVEPRREHYSHPVIV